MKNLEILFDNKKSNLFDRFSFINYRENIDCCTTDCFANFINNDNQHYLDLNFLLGNLTSSNHCVDFKKIQINTIQHYKLLILLAASIYKVIKLDDDIINTLDKENDFFQFIEDLYVYFHNTDYLDVKNIQILYNKNDILIYSINKTYFLYNFSDWPEKIVLPDVLQNKNFYSIFCNNDKYLKETFIFGKYNFYLLEEI